MTHPKSNPAALGDYVEVIQAVHLIDKRNQARRTWQAIVLATLPTVLGGLSAQGVAVYDEPLLSSTDTGGTP